jgi:hypothetical protein
MLFKSGKFCSSIFFNSWTRFSTSVLLAASACALFSSLSFATLTVTAISQTQGGVTLNNSINGVYYYPSYVSTGNNNLVSPAAAVAATGVIDPAFSFVDLGQDPSWSGAINQAGIILFNIQSTATLSAPAVVVVTVNNGVSGNTPASALSPIITAGGGMCANSSSCQDNFGFAGLNSNGSYFYAANYTQGQILTVGISPEAICRSFQQLAGGNYASGCNSQFFTSQSPVTANPTQMTISFAIYLATDLNTAPSTTLPTNPAQDGPQQIVLGYQTLNPAPTPTPTAICNISDGIYTPVQSGIQINGGAQYFSMAGDPSGVTTPAQIVVVANPSPTPLNFLATNYTTGNAINQPVPAESGAPAVGGFQNTTSASDPLYYTVGFLVEDAAGFVFDPQGANSCVLPGPFDTSVIQGFLSSSKCFIATAAFRSKDDAPLVLLREFRDEILENFDLGRSFVHWYYAWSPNAADWLVDHPVFRFPVLLALIPLQLFAWTLLHPSVVLILLASSIALLGWALLARLKVLRRSTE